MSKLINRPANQACTAFLAGIALFICSFSNAVLGQRATVTSTATRQAAIVRTTEEVLRETSKIRGLAILRPVKSGAQSRAQIESMLLKKLDQQMTAAQMRASEASLKKFGLVPADFHYRAFIIKLLTEQVAGYYDPTAKRFHLADWLEIDGQKPVMAHELTHALQDQHFNLRRFEKWPDGDSDAELAAHALIEGDATLAMTYYIARNPLVALAFMQSLSGDGLSLEQFNQAPRVLRETLTFPYLQGMEWARQVHNRGGWLMVSRAYRRLPQSTEQILHAEKYFDGERPTKIRLRDLALLLNSSAKRASPTRSLGTRATSPANSRARPRRPLASVAWQRIDTDVNGEWGYYLILDEFLKSPEESRRAAAGWAGDRFALYEGPNGQVLLAQVTMWDAPEDAREFFDAYVKRTALRYPDAQTLSDSNLETRRVWKTKEGRVIIELHGMRLVVLEGIPEGADSDELFKFL